MTCCIGWYVCFKLLSDPVFVPVVDLETHNQEPADFSQLLSGILRADTGEVVITSGAVRPVSTEQATWWKKVPYTRYVYTDIPGMRFIFVHSSFWTIFWVDCVWGTKLWMVIFLFHLVGYVFQIYLLLVHLIRLLAFRLFLKHLRNRWSSLHNIVWFTLISFFFF